jgi:hypothetical protein
MDPTLLQELLDVSVEPINTFCKSDFIDNFNNQIGLPRCRDIALRVGSSVGFKVLNHTNLTRLQDQLRHIEEHGIGLRRQEGFGQVVFNHPIYSQGSHMTGQSINLQHCPGLALAHPPHTQPAIPIKVAFDCLKSWVHKLQDSREFSEALFRDEKWQAVARWLYENAKRPVAELLPQLAQFGDAKIITSGERLGQKLLMSTDTKAMQAIQGWLQEIETQPEGLRQAIIELLANRIGASVETKEL